MNNGLDPLFDLLRKQVKTGKLDHGLVNTLMAIDPVHTGRILSGF